MPLLNGLNGKCDNIINVIMHREPFPTFEEAHSILILEEDRLSKRKKTISHKDESSSSPKVFVVTTSSLDQTSSSQGGHQQHNFQNRGRGCNRGRGRYNDCHQRPQYNNGMFFTGKLGFLRGLNNNLIHGYNSLNNPMLSRDSSGPDRNNNKSLKVLITTLEINKYNRPWTLPLHSIP